MTVVFWALFSILLCGACSIVETVLYSTRTIALVERLNERGIAELIAIKQKRLGDAISAILIVNTIAGTIGAGFVGAEAARIWGSSAVGVASAVLTFLMLILAEVGPKTFAATHAMELAAPAGRVLSVALKVLAPCLIVTRIVTRWMTGKDDAGLTRVGLARLISNAPAQGTLTAAESEVLAHILFAHRVTLSEIRTPIELVVSAAANAPASTLLDRKDVAAFARIPLWQESKRHIPTYVNQRSALRALLQGADAGHVLSTFSHALPQIPEESSIGRAIDLLLHAQESIGAVVADGEAVGIVTLEDLFEALLGFDITDEADAVTGMRSEAETARRHRLQALWGRRGKWARGLDSR
ncbi:CNNM domain-containing protein [Reyranella sp.]|jgi:Mg2+/Co2+ transporter CorB|uniref:CNNM domain-containing protein n=1 Tax=Reyranella sp. TaxID=1929291 RepID=UPI000BCD7390|nr:CNNM domain-containing protein [Reyranella sp.]OYW32707.1 MAG: hypothetical protein B7Z41_07550 [Rhizobiales bacterium 12-66-7]OYZ82987.1 MAG: hypothetical protein B7Y12_01210 [Rhizobiales bacterium 24-66-13]OZB12234.1 MAG: hypothetical protein B7X67_00175 [Rhizobiales bacterium 39-66-18]HQS44928.1 CNNM domain-containing protein [Xanthobacteraceae bacterium]